MSSFFQGPQTWMQYFRWNLTTVEQIDNLILYIDAEVLLAGFVSLRFANMCYRSEVVW